MASLRAVRLLETEVTEELLTQGLAALDIESALVRWAPWHEVEADIRERFTGALADHSVKETRVKYVDGAGLRDRWT